MVTKDCCVCGKKTDDKREIADTRFPRPFNFVCPECFHLWTSNLDDEIYLRVKRKIMPPRVGDKR